MLTKFLLEFWLVWVRYLLNFASKLEGRGTKKPWFSVRFFSFFAISANLPTRSHMIDFLVNLALNLALKIHQKSTQEAPKINKKSIKNNVQDVFPFLIIFSWFWRPLGPQVGSHVEAMLATKPSKKRLRKQHKKTLKKEGPGKSGTPEIRSWRPLIIQKTTLSRLQFDKTRPHS